MTLLICLTFQKLSKSHQALKFRFTARQCCKRWQTLTLDTKLAAGATNGRFEVTQNRLLVLP